MLADMHIAGQSYPRRAGEPARPEVVARGGARGAAVPRRHRTRSLLESELEFQSRFRGHDLQRGPVHADLFRDNVLFEDARIGGVVDFYFAGVDAWLFDVAVTLNDWCVEPDGALDRARADAFLAAYHAVRPVHRRSSATPGR